MLYKLKMTDKDSFLFKMGAIGLDRDIKRTYIYQGESRLFKRLNAILDWLGVHKFQFRQIMQIEQVVQFSEIKVKTVHENWLFFETNNVKIVQEKKTRI